MAPLREHVKRYWSMSYKRTLGISLITSSMVLVIGLVFNILTQNAINAHYLTFLIYWVILILIALFVSLSYFFNSHVSSVKLMDDEEYKVNSKRMGLWMICIVTGVIVFLSPIFFLPDYTEPIVVLFAFGGIFLVLYASVRIIFKNSYKELIIGTAACWFMVAFYIIQVSNLQQSAQSLASYNLYFGVMSIMIISSLVGLAMLFNSANESNIEFMKMVKQLERNEQITALNATQIRELIKKGRAVKSTKSK
jgi:archaellum component FlaF (FlaF/FlaG flagellin family)